MACEISRWFCFVFGLCHFCGLTVLLVCGFVPFKSSTGNPPPTRRFLLLAEELLVKSPCRLVPQVSRALSLAWRIGAAHPATDSSNFFFCFWSLLDVPEFSFSTPPAGVRRSSAPRIPSLRSTQTMTISMKQCTLQVGGSYLASTECGFSFFAALGVNVQDCRLYLRCPTVKDGASKIRPAFKRI